MEFNLENYLNQIAEIVAQYVPNLLSALVILVIGWLIAVIVSKLVGASLRRTGLDKRLAASVGDKDAFEGISLGRAIAKLVFYLIMFFVLVAFFQALGLTLITEPLNRFLIQIFDYLPRLIGPAILLLIAWVVASSLRFLVRRLLSAARVDERLGEQVGADEESAVSLSDSLAEAVYWLVLLLFLPAVLGGLGLDGLLQPVQNLVDSLVGFLPNLIAAAVILGVGWLVAKIVQRILSSLLAATALRSSGSASSSLLATLARISILVLAAAIALREMGLANEIINLAFGLLLGAVAVAAAIAFGLGGRDAAARQLEEWKGSGQAEPPRD